MVCIKFEYASKFVYCEQNVFSHVAVKHTKVTKTVLKKGSYDMLYKRPYSFVTTGPNRKGSSLTGREIVVLS